ncbi:glycoside hydrolase family 26 protein [Oerskovia sp. NPDC057915]|uniref:glycoside hydrolase family 26 protein n=1 Tax=Oerskovia sp. NPDC057915 TaxID=3346280 RepID=UPI0036D92E55
MTFYLPGTGGRRRRPGLVTPLVVMLAGVGAVGAGFAVAGPPPAPEAPAAEACTADAASIVPDDGTLLGVNLDWASETLEEHRAYLDHAPAVAVQFSDVPYDRETWEHTVSAVTQMKANGGVLLLTLEPHAGLAAMSDDVIATLADDLRDVNEQGVAVVLRFAHEMNGSWYAWGQQPTAYVETFRRVAAAVHAEAPGTAMMWAPNYGGGYPFTGGQFAALPGSADYAALDTDHDGTVTMADDSYLPYFPGDDAVDWVGVSLYHWGNQRPWGNNEVPEDGKFLAMLTGTYVGTAGDDAAVPDFYTVYGVEHGHPVAVPETAAIYTPSRGGAAELDIKRAWWRQVFSSETHERFPQLKMVNWFEWDKYEIEIDDDVDWRAAGAPDVRDAFVADLPSWLRYAEDVSTCEE